MKTLSYGRLPCWLLVAGLALSLAAPADAHGGRYRGPGDIVPPGTTPRPPRPPKGSPGPKTDGPRPPAPTPPGPITGPRPPRPGPNTGPPSAPGPSVPGPRTPRSTDLGDDLSKWTYWWGFNKDPFLMLKDSVHAPRPTTGDAEIYLGPLRRHSPIRSTRPDDNDIQGRILPALKRALDNTTNRDITSSCIMALAKIGRDHAEFEILPIFRKHLVSHDQAIRETAALAMGLSQKTEATEDLIALALDTVDGRELVGRGRVDDRSRSFAAYGLGLIAHAHNNGDLKRRILEAMRPILEAKRSVDRNVRVAAIQCISLLNLDPKSSDPKKKRLLLDALQVLDDFYGRDLGRGRELVQAHVPTAIARLLGRGQGKLHSACKEKCLRQLSRPKPPSHDIHRSAILALGQLAQPAELYPEDRKYSEALRRYFAQGRDYQARYFALIALGQIGGNQNRQALLKILAKGKRALERPWAALALGVYAHGTAARTGVREPDETIGAALQEQLKAVASPYAKAAMAIALGLCRYKDAGPDLLKQLRSRRHQNELAGYLCVGLALMDYQHARHYIEELAQTSLRRPERLKQAAVALGKLGDPRLTSRLVEMLDDAESNVAKMSAVAMALSYIGDRVAISPLLEMLFRDSTPALSRAFAAVALGGIADKEKLPWNSKIAVNLNYRAAVETLTQSGTGVLDLL